MYKYRFKVNKNRKIKELLKVMLQNKELLKNISLCTFAHTLRISNKISYKEYSKLLKFIQDNRPNKYSSLDAFLYRNRMHYWKLSNKEVRINWIKKHLKTFKNIYLIVANKYHICDKKSKK